MRASYLLSSTPCPCGSGKVDHLCCLDKDGRWSPRRLAIRQPGGRTGKRVNHCYAASLGDCDGVLSREHYVSACVLRLVAESPVMEGVRGVGRIEGVNNMVARVLCERHNNILSPLDDLARRFTEVVRGFFPGMSQSTFAAGSETFLFHHGDVSRVLLKFLCATEAAGVLKGAMPSPCGWTPPESWLNILFDDGPWPTGWGLYVPVLWDGDVEHAEGITFGRRVDQEGGIVGAEYVIGGLPFILLMTDLRDVTNWHEPDFQSVHAHPSRVIVHVAGVTKTLEFGRRIDGRDLTINHRIAGGRVA